MKLLSFMVGLVVVIVTIWESGLAEIIVPCNDPGGFVVITYVNFPSYIAPIPGSSNSDDKVDLGFPYIKPVNSVAFQQATSTLFRAQEGPFFPLTSNIPTVYRYPVAPCSNAEPYAFLEGSSKPGYTAITFIVAMTIDEANNRLYWAEMYWDDRSSRVYAIWTVSLKSENANEDKELLYDDPYMDKKASAVITDLKFDPSTQQLYWVLHTGIRTTAITRRAWADGSGIITSREFAVGSHYGFLGIELDILGGNIYWGQKTNCKIVRLSIDEFVSGSVEEVYSSNTCMADEFFLSLAEDSFYIFNDIDGNIALIQIPLAGGPGSEEVIVSDFGIGPSGNTLDVIFVPNCPVQVHEISFTASEYTAYEGDTNFAVVVQKSLPCYEFEEFVRVINFGGTASRPSDYSRLVNGQAESLDSRTIQFKESQTSVSVGFEIYTDDRTEGNETFIVEIADVSPSTSSVLGDITRAVVTIIDKSSYVQFTESKLEVTEGKLTLLIRIERIGNLESSTVVRLMTSPVTAMAGNDYEPAITDVSFNAFQSEAIAVVTIYDDEELEMDETFQISFVEPQSEGQSSAEILIKDNEIGYSFQQTGYEFNEDIGQIIIPVERIGSTDAEGSIDITFYDSNEDHKAVLGDDISQFNPNTLTFLPGESTANIKVLITDDNQYESTEFFQIALSEPQPEGSDIIIANTTVSILDDEENIRFVEHQATVLEGQTTILRFPITRDVALKETHILITSCEPYRSALGGEDFVPINSVVVRFPVGEMIAYTPDIIILNDNQGEVHETFRLVITSPEQGAIACNEDMTNDIYIGIIDDDGATYRFSSSNYVIPEYSANLKVRINQEGILQDDDQERVILSAISGSATNNQDFVFNGPRRLNFGATGYTDVLIQIVSDNEYELGESFTLELTNDAGDILDTATVTIRDDDRPATPPHPQSYYFSKDSIQVEESTEGIRVAVLRTDRSMSATILIDTVTGSATPGVDYFPRNRYPVKFSAGDLIAEKVIYIIDDAESEGTEIFQVVLSSPTDGGSITGGPLTINITDNDDISDNTLPTRVMVGIIAGISGAFLVLALLMVFGCIALFRRASNGRRAPTAVPPVQYNRPYGQPISFSF